MTDVQQEQLAGAVAIRRAISSCYRCNLRLEATQPVPFRGPLNPTLAVLGEAPGRNEDTDVRPFVGPAGRFLTTSLEAAGFQPREVGFLNAACCFPSSTQTPQREHLEACRVHLVGQIQAIRPSHLLTVGVTAYSAVMPRHRQVPMRALLGRPWWLERLDPWPVTLSGGGISVLSTYHPAARSPSQKLRMKEDIQLFARWITAKEPFPSSCTKVRCDKEVEKWDDHGLAWCSDHKGVQGELL